MNSEIQPKELHQEEKIFTDRVLKVLQNMLESTCVTFTLDEDVTRPVDSLMGTV